MSDLGNLNEFMKVARMDAWNKIKKNPARIFYGAVDPASTWAWNKILGRNDKPILNQLGSPQGGGGLGLSKKGGVYADAKQQGVDVKAGRRFFGIGDTIAGFYGGSAAGSALGGGSGGASSGLGSGASVGGSADGLAAGTAADSAAAGGAFSSAAGPTVASQFVAPAASYGSTAGSAVGGGASTSTQLLNSGMGILKQAQQQPQQQVQAQYPVEQPNPQEQQRRQIAMQQELQMQALRAKPNKTLDDLQQMKMLQNQQGLLGGMQ